jgi:hypothetical protein
MELMDDPATNAFRLEIQAFLRAKLPESVRKAVAEGGYLGREEHTRWHRTLHEKGWVAPAWPVEHGGCGWSLEKQYVFEQEFALANAPRAVIFGVDMVGPLLIEYGTPEQQKRYLPKILTGEEWWCQGFSEPGSGSDLASLACRAKREGDRYVINGTKIWQTLATEADMMFGLFRTDSTGKKQDGITVLLVDMKSKGLTLRPITLIDGSQEVAQCFFDDVRVPAADRVGEENKGWSCAKYLLGIERLGIAEVARSRAMFARLKSIVETPDLDGRRQIDDPEIATRMTEIEIDLMALEATEYRMLFDPARGGEVGAEASTLKLVGTQVQQRISEATMEAGGYYAQASAAGWEGDNAQRIGPAFAELASRNYFNLRKISIYGGSNEIQKNIVAKAVLGL